MADRDNYVAATNALQHVAQKVPLGAGNKVSDLIASGLSSGMCVLTSRLIRLGESVVGYQPEWAKGKLNIEILAMDTEKVGCGNCGEQSAVAFVYLKQRGYRPLDWMCISNGDHAFVVIGRASGSKESQPASWGEAAVVCDPWYKTAYPAQSIFEHLPSDSKFESLLRID